MRKVLFLVGVVILVLSLLAPLSASAAPVRKPFYDVIPMGFFEATAINDRGQVAGKSGSQIAIWYRGQITTVSIPGYKFAAVVDINDAGTLLLTALGKTGVDYFLVRGKWVLRLNLPIGSTAQTFNNANTVAGQVHDSRTNTQRGFLWHAGRIRYITEASYGYCWIVDINNRGQVTGFFFGMGDGDHPFVWSRGRLTMLETPDGEGRSTGINSYGQVSGSYTPYDGYDRYGLPISSYESYPVVWRSNGQMRRLENNGMQGTAMGINTRQAIGGLYSNNGVTPSYVAIWQDDGEMFRLEDRLNAPIRPFATGMHLNNAGQIICYSYQSNPPGNGGYFFLQPRYLRR